MFRFIILYISLLFPCFLYAWEIKITEFSGTEEKACYGFSYTQNHDELNLLMNTVFTDQLLSNYFTTIISQSLAWLTNISDLSLVHCPNIELLNSEIGSSQLIISERIAWVIFKDPYLKSRYKINFN